MAVTLPMLLFVVAGVIVLILALARPSSMMKDERGRLIPASLLAQLRLHQARAHTLTDPTALMKLRLDFASSIGLGEMLLRFHENVRYMPSWYTLKERFPRTEAWSSSVIAREDIAKVKPKELAAYGIDLMALAACEVDEEEEGDLSDDSDDLRLYDPLVLKFSSSGQQYVFCAHCEAVPSWVSDVEGESHLMFDALRAYVIELPARVVLEDRIIYKSGDLNEYRSDHVESFRPADWLVALFSLAAAVEAEAEQKHAEFTKRSDAERAKNFM